MTLGPASANEHRPRVVGVKEFVVYTALRIALFLATFALVAGIWFGLADRVDGTDVLVAFVIAFVVSGVGSYFLLSRQREAFARRVEDRAERAGRSFEERRAKEDVD